MKAILAPFDESDSILALHYALQEAGLPCSVLPTGDPGTVRLEPAQCNSLNLDGEMIHRGKVQGFLMGWVARHRQEALPNDDPLNVSSCPQIPTDPERRKAWDEESARIHPNQKTA